MTGTLFKLNRYSLCGHIESLNHIAQCVSQESGCLPTVAISVAQKSFFTELLSAVFQKLDQDGA